MKKTNGIIRGIIDFIPPMYIKKFYIIEESDAESMIPMMMVKS